MAEKETLVISRRFSYQHAMLACTYGALCSGCDWLLKPKEEQHKLKIAALKDAWPDAFGPSASVPPEIRYISIAESGLRDRVDLVFDRRSGKAALGLFDWRHSEILDLQGCPQLSSQLENWLKEFRREFPPIERGSVRLRVGPDGRRGVWLDFSNLDVKNLLEERNYLDWLREQAVVEIGQRRKRLVERDGVLKLADPVLEPWFATWLGKEAKNYVPLYCTIGSFTQPGLTSNHALVSEVQEILSELTFVNAKEFGCGIGNFTLPLASMCRSVDVFEIDALALAGLSRSLSEAHLAENVQIHRGDFQSTKSAELAFAGTDLILVDPPRSGLKSFIAPILSAAKSNSKLQLVYVSCFADSFAADAARLVEAGFQTRKLSIVDQFPQSRHFEIVAHFEACLS